VDHSFLLESLFLLNLFHFISHSAVRKLKDQKELKAWKNLDNH